MNKHPLVSIVILTYNQIKLIRETLTSAVEQGYENLEIIVSDDGSQDGTAEVILEYAAKYPHIVPLVGGPNLGITGNSNRALKACRGKYVAFLGGDDVMLPERIKNQVESLEKSADRVLCCTPVIEFGEGRQDTIWTPYKKFKSLKRKAEYTLDDIIALTNIFRSSSVMIRADAAPSYGFDERLTLTSDWKMCIDVLRCHGKFVILDKPFTRYRIHDKNITKMKNILLSYEALLTPVLFCFDNKKYFFRIFFPVLKQSYWLLRSIIRWAAYNLVEKGFNRPARRVEK